MLAIVDESRFQALLSKSIKYTFKIRWSQITCGPLANCIGHEYKTMTEWVLFMLIAQVSITAKNDFVCWQEAFIYSFPLKCIQYEMLLRASSNSSGPLLFKKRPFLILHRAVFDDNLSNSDRSSVNQWLLLLKNYNEKLLNSSILLD